MREGAALGVYRAQKDEYHEALIARRVQDQVMKKSDGSRSGSLGPGRCAAPRFERGDRDAKPALFLELHVATKGATGASHTDRQTDSFSIAIPHPHRIHSVSKIFAACPVPCALIATRGGLTLCPNLSVVVFVASGRISDALI